MEERKNEWMSKQGKYGQTVAQRIIEWLEEKHILMLLFQQLRLGKDTHIHACVLLGSKRILMWAEHTWSSEGVRTGDTEHYVKPSDLNTSLHASYMPSLYPAHAPPLILWVVK